ncbi:S49 family peptidase [Psittacicella hinzii]|nr:S49 family peptidase [Psittacicella hinzii]
MIKKLLFAIWLLVKYVYKALSWVVFTLFAVFGLLVVVFVLYLSQSTKTLTASVDERFTGEKYLYLDLELVTEKSLRLPGYYNLAVNLGVDLPSQVSIRDLRAVLEAAAKDERIKGVVIDVERATFETFGIHEELDRAIVKFKEESENKKPVIGYSRYWSVGDFVALQHADTLVTDRVGSPYLSNSVSAVFLKDFYENYGIKDYSFQAGKYGLSALRVQNSFTEDNQFSLESITYKPVDYAFADFSKTRTAILKDKTVSLKPRELFSVESLVADAYTLKNEAELFVERGLFDKAVTRFQWGDYLRDQAGIDEDKYPNLVYLDEYLSDLRVVKSEDKTDYSTKDYYLTYYYSGFYGQTGADVDANSVASELLNRTVLAEAPKEGKGKVKGIVLRLDSIGGTLPEAQVLYSALRKVSESGVPVVVLTGDGLLGSAYLAATGADAIVASKYVPVGGVNASSNLIDSTDALRAFYNMNPSYFKGSQLVTSGANLPFPFNLVVSGSSVLVSPQFAEYRKVVTLGQYETAVENLAKARSFTPEQLAKVDQGRIFTGQDAYEVKLVDALGGVEVAYEYLDKLNKEKDENFDATAIVKYEANPESSPYSSLLATLNSEINAFADYKARQEFSLSATAYKALKFEQANNGAVFSMCELCVTPTAKNETALSVVGKGNSFVNELVIRLTR